MAFHLNTLGREHISLAFKGAMQTRETAPIIAQCTHQCSRCRSFFSAWPSLMENYLIKAATSKPHLDASALPVFPALLGAAFSTSSYAPHVNSAGLLAWKPGTAKSVYKCLPELQPLGHGTDHYAMYASVFLLQVSYLDCCSLKTSHRFPIAVLCPLDVKTSCSGFYCMQWLLTTMSYFHTCFRRCRETNQTPALSVSMVFRQIRLMFPQS